MTFGTDSTGTTATAVSCTHASEQVKEGKYFVLANSLLFVFLQCLMVPQRNAGVGVVTILKPLNGLSVKYIWNGLTKYVLV